MLDAITEVPSSETTTKHRINSVKRLKTIERNFCTERITFTKRLGSLSMTEETLSRSQVKLTADLIKILIDGLRLILAFRQQIIYKYISAVIIDLPNYKKMS